MLLRFHLSRTLHYPRILAVGLSSLTINSSADGPQMINITGLVPQSRRVLIKSTQMRVGDGVTAVAAGHSAQGAFGTARRAGTVDQSLDDLPSEKGQPTHYRGLLLRSGRAELTPLRLLICPLWLSLPGAVADIRARHLSHRIARTVAAVSALSSTHQVDDEKDEKNGS